MASAFFKNAFWKTNDTIGMKNIASRNSMLLDHLIELLKGLDVELSDWIDEKTHRSSYTGFSSKVSADSVYNSLKERGGVILARSLSE